MYRKASNRVTPKEEHIEMTPTTSGENNQHKLYQMVDMHGGGELIKWMRYARKGGDYSIVDGYFETIIRQSMYNAGKGKLEAVAELVKRRNMERNERLGAFSRKKGKGKSGPNILEDFNQEASNQGDLQKALQLLDGGKGGKGDARYREIIWKIEERGSMGESLVGCCLMQGGPIHKELAIRLLDEYPKLVNDVMLSEDYYGLSPLHQSIVNEDPTLTNFLLQKGADVNQRCYGAFFCPDDLKSSRTDSMEHEYVELSEKTNYTGRMYFGEYPLAFAACTNQFDCYRLLRAKRADPNLQDTNGNTVLHMTVIHEKMEMLKLVYDTGGARALQIMNRQNLTPLTLAAKLAKKNMFEQILHLESNTVWVYGHASSIAYPLGEIDTINQETGELNEDSALSLVVYGKTTEHLNLLDGLLEDLLEAKWEHFARRRWILSLVGFCFYYAVFFTAFVDRPFPRVNMYLTNHSASNRSSHLADVQFTHNNSTVEENDENESENSSDENRGFFASLFHKYATEKSCQLWHYKESGFYGDIRAVCESLVLVMVVIQLTKEVIDLVEIGWKRWWQNIMTFPTKGCYKLSLVFVLILVPVRLSCGLGAAMHALDNSLTIVTIILCTMHFLFYCRVIRYVGPFVYMVYTIVTRDVSRFFLIYLIFLAGFSQSFYIVFLACERERQIRAAQNGEENGEELKKRLLNNPIEVIIRLFLMTIDRGLDSTISFYRELDTCPAELMSMLGKWLFMVFEVILGLILLNMLIAMMTRTYKTIYNTQKEWKRQWAQVILMVELSIKPKERLMALLQYSRPIGTDKTKRAFVVTRKKEPDNETKHLEMEEQAELRRVEKRMIYKRRLKDARQKYYEFTGEELDRRDSLDHTSVHLNVLRTSTAWGVKSRSKARTSTAWEHESGSGIYE